MRSLVKTQFLVDLAELPLRGLSASMSAGQWWNEEMELDLKEEEPEPKAQDGKNNPGEANIGLG